MSTEAGSARPTLPIPESKQLVILGKEKGEAWRGLAVSLSQQLKKLGDITLKTPEQEEQEAGYVKAGENPDLLWVRLHRLYPKDAAAVAYLTIRSAQIMVEGGEIPADIDSEQMHREMVSHPDLEGYLVDFNQRQILVGEGAALRLLKEEIEKQPLLQRWEEYKSLPSGERSLAGRSVLVDETAQFLFGGDPAQRRYLSQFHKTAGTSMAGVFMAADRLGLYKFADNDPAKEAYAVTEEEEISDIQRAQKLPTSTGNQETKTAEDQKPVAQEEVVEEQKPTEVKSEVSEEVTPPVEQVNPARADYLRAIAAAKAKAEELKAQKAADVEQKPEKSSEEEAIREQLAGEPELSNLGGEQKKPTPEEPAPVESPIAFKPLVVESDKVQPEPVLTNMGDIDQRSGKSSAPEIIQLPVSSPFPLPPTRPQEVQPKQAPFKETIILGQEAMGKSPEEMINQINQRLDRSQSNEVSLQTTPQAVLDYLKTVSLPAGAKIKGSTEGRINGNEFIINGAVSTFLGDAKFNVAFSQTQDGKLIVNSKPRVETSMRLGLALRAKGINLENMIARLDQIATDQISQRVDPNWSLTGFGIAGGNLAFNFRRKR